MLRVTPARRARLLARREALLPGGIPRWFRACDDRGESFDRYTYLLTGKRGNGFYRGCSEHPFHPQGFGISDSSGRWIGGRWYPHPVDMPPGCGLFMAPAIGRKHPFLGWRIGWADLPPDVRRGLVRDYCAVWGVAARWRPRPVPSRCGAGCVEVT